LSPLDSILAIIALVAVILAAGSTVFLLLQFKPAV
jgi:hypothetical protein